MIMIVIWPVGVPIIYAFSIWLRSGVFRSLKLIEADIVSQREETKMRELLAKEEKTFSMEYEHEVLLRCMCVPAAAKAGAMRSHSRERSCVPECWPTAHPRVCICSLAGGE